MSTAVGLGTCSGAWLSRDPASRIPRPLWSTIPAPGRLRDPPLDPRIPDDVHTCYRMLDPEASEQFYVNKLGIKFRICKHILPVPGVHPRRLPPVWAWPRTGRIDQSVEKGGAAKTAPPELKSISLSARECRKAALCASGEAVRVSSSAFLRLPPRAQLSSHARQPLAEYIAVCTTVADPHARRYGYGEYERRASIPCSDG